MPVVWKALLGMLLTLPAGAYVAGTIVGPYDAPQPPGQSAPAPGSPTTGPGRDTSTVPAYVGPTEAPVQPLDTMGPTATGEDGRSGPGPGARSDRRGDTLDPRIGDSDGDLASESPTETGPTDGATESPGPSETGEPTDGTTSGTPSDTPSDSGTEPTTGSTGTSTGTPSSGVPGTTTDPYPG